MNTDRYDRQQRIKGWQQEALAQASVLVAGAGALGNELIKNLTLIGIGHILVVDLDRVELSNLSRTVLFRTSDIDRPKAQVAAEAVVQLNPDVDIRYIDGDLFYDVGLGFYRHSDLVVSGLDNLAARSQVGLSCSLAGVPFLDGGMWALGGEIRWFLPGNGPCFECTLNDEDRKRAYERRSCTGFRIQEDNPFLQRMPSTVSTTAVIGGILAQEVVRYLCGWEVTPGEAIVYNGLVQTMHKTSLPHDPECPYHRAYQNVIELESGTTELTARDILEQAEEDPGNSAILELGRDFLLGFHCKTCYQYEHINELLGRVDESSRKCPKCGNFREPDTISRLDGSEIQANRSLSELGVPPGEVLAARSEELLCMYECTGDVEKFWT